MFRCGFAGHQAVQGLHGVETLAMILNPSAESGLSTPEPLGQRMHRPHRGHALRDGPCLAHDLLHGVAPAQHHPHGPVPAEAPVQVSTRSPMPARPAKVSGRAPSATPRRLISASPRVMSAATALCPSSRPAADTRRQCDHILRAPPSSTPPRPGWCRRGSGRSGRGLCSQARLPVVAGHHHGGRSPSHHLARKARPDRTHCRFACARGRASAKISSMRRSVATSIPFEAETTSASGGKKRAAFASSAAEYCTGQTHTTASAPSGPPPASW